LKITFETATLIDALRKAEAIAPKGGSGQDTTYGIILEPDADNQTFVAKSTDGTFFYMESIPIIDIEGTGKEIWRVPSSMFYGSISKLPARMGMQVTLTKEENQIVARSNKTTIKIATLSSETFPEFEFYDSTAFHEFTNITGKSNKLKWAISHASAEALSCVLVNGNYMYATNRYVAARITLDADTNLVALYPPLTLSRVVPFGVDVRVAKDGNLLVISPDEFSQLLMATMDPATFPSGAIDAMMIEHYEHKIQFSKNEALRMLDGVAPMLDKKVENGEAITIYIGRNEIAIFFQNESGAFQDAIEIQGVDCDHKRLKFSVTHSIIRGAIDSMADNVEMEYSEIGPTSLKFRFNDGNYSTVMMLRKGN